MTASFVIALFIVSGALIYIQAPATAWLVWALIWIAAGWLAGIAGPVVTTLLAIVFVVPALILAIKPLRRVILTRSIFDLFRKILPQMSPTERDAIEAGTVWWDAALFSGRPKWDTLLETGAPVLTAEERDFIEGECTSSAISPMTGKRPPSGRISRQQRGRSSSQRAFSA